MDIFWNKTNKNQLNFIFHYTLNTDLATNIVRNFKTFYIARTENTYVNFNTMR